MRVPGRGPVYLLALIGLLALGAILPVGASAATGSPVSAPAEISQFPLSSESLFPGQLVAGADGNMWFLLGEAEQGHTGAEPVNPRTVIDRITPDGQITEYPLLGPSREARALTAGPEGDLWYLTPFALGRMTLTGQVTEIPFSAPEKGNADFMTTGADGNFWVASESKLDYGTISRVTPAGESADFPIPTHESGLGEIVLGPDGNVWFGEEFGRKIGRITPSGQITEFPVPERPGSLAVGPEGDIWFSQGQTGVGRITPTGEVSTFPVEHGRYPSAWPLTSGPDGRLWFHSETNVLGRISPAGRVSYVRLPYRAGTLIDAAAGPDGSIWYTAEGQSPCEGGGGTCMMTIFSQPGMVGRITPGSLAVRIGRSLPWPHARLARVSVSCEGALPKAHAKAVFVSARAG